MHMTKDGRRLGMVLLRRRAGLSQEEAAAKADIAAATLSQIERGENNPREETLTALAGVYGVTIERIKEECPKTPRIKSAQRNRSKLADALAKLIDKVDSKADRKTIEKAVIEIGVGAR